jgi:hypothetical protein
VPPALETLHERLVYSATVGGWLAPHDVRGVLHDTLFFRAHLSEQDVHLADLRATSARQAVDLEALATAHADLRREHAQQTTAHDEARRIFEADLIAARGETEHARLEAVRLQHALDEAELLSADLRDRSAEQQQENAAQYRILTRHLHVARAQAAAAAQETEDTNAQRNSAQIEYATVLHDVEELEQQALAAAADADAARDARDIVRATHARTRADRDALLVDLATAHEDLALARTALAAQTRALETERGSFQEELRGLRTSLQGNLHSMVQARDAALAAASHAADTDALDSRNDAVLALILAARFARGAHVAAVSEVAACWLSSTAALRRRDALRQLRERLDHGEDRILTLTQIIEGIRDFAQLKTRDDALRGRLACIAKLATLEDAEAST